MLAYYRHSKKEPERAGLKVHYSRRQDLANAVIAASRVGSYPYAARRMSPLWPLAHIHGRSSGATGERKMRPTHDAILQVVLVRANRRALED
jgi:hypothetical protein